MQHIRVERLKKLIAESYEGRNKIFSSKSGIAESQISQYIGGNRNIGEKTARKIELIAGKPMGWLDGSVHIAEEQPATYNVNPIKAKSQRFPIVSWVQAGEPTEIKDGYLIDEWAWAWYSNPSKRAFALRVEGDSMTSPYPSQQSFPEGTLLIVDPERAANAGDYVIAKDISTQKATFKRLVQDAGRWFLKAINPAYPLIEIDDPAIRVIARVIEYQPPGGKL